MPVFNEKSAVEDYIIDRLQEDCWEYKGPDELERDSYQEPLLVNNLVRAIKKINRHLDLSDEDIKKILDDLRYKSTGMEGIKQILWYLKEGCPIKLEKEKTLRYVNLLDHERPGNNEFIVSRQVTYKSAGETIRTDIVLYVNGIPLVVIECKNPADPTVSWYDGYRQIKGYEKKIPELFKYVQFSMATAETAKYFPNVPWLDYVDVHTWRKEEFDILEATLEMFKKETILDLIQNFIFVREEKGKANKVIARYMQYRAANKIFDRVIDNLQGKTEKNSGLIWHWQGSGKTLIMVFTAYKLFKHKTLENPSIFFILDRVELEEQIRDEFAALNLPFEMITSIRKLTNMLLHDDGRGKRGVFITLIQKFRNEELLELRGKLDKLKGSGEETILGRKNVVSFVDEGHRSQYGSLASEMRTVLSNAFFFAFTGTPIAKRGRDTYRIFSYPEDKENYLDRYFILDSIRDGFTVPIRYQSRLEKKVHLNKETLESFLTEEFEEIPDEYKEDVEQKMRRKLDTVRVMMKNPKRIETISMDIGEHFSENIDEKFKAMVVAVDRKACVLYKEMLDKILPPEYSEIVMTFNEKDREHEDRKEIWEYFKALQKKYHEKDEGDIRKKIITKFKEEEYPKILIVTDMLLTGFDAPILQVMYLDKPLKEHRLLQAIARTNRPFKGVKEAGLILDYVGIFREFEKAIAIYSKDDIAGVAYNLEEEKKEFVKLMNEAKQIFTGINTQKVDRETLMKAVRRLVESKNKARKFEITYRTLKRKFELLGPDPMKIQYLNEFKWISAVYYAYIRHVKRIDPDEADRYVRKYFRKTLDYIHETTDIDKIKKDFPIISLDEKYIEKVEKAYSDLESRISDIAFTLTKFVLVDRARNPIYESIADKVERILKNWEERKKANKDIYEELKQAIGEFNESGGRQKKLKLTNLEYYTLLILEKHLEKDEKLVEDAKELIQSISDKRFKGWTLQKSAVKDIGRTIRKSIRKYKISTTERDKIYEDIIKTLKKSD